MPEDRNSATAIAKSTSTTFGHRREDIFSRLQQSVEQCKLNYSGRKELATEQDDTVAELCEALEEAFSYGLRQQHATAVLTATTLFQNMQEIITGQSGSPASSSGENGGETTFWDFCQVHLTPHERARYEQLKHIWTKCGRGKAFIRASLNEGSLHRYLATWLANEEQLQRHYTMWSLLLDAEKATQLPAIVGSLGPVLFALTVDTTELNVPTRTVPNVLAREEPIIYAPTPVPLVAIGQKRKVNTVERPIVTPNSPDDLLVTLQRIGLPDGSQPPLAEASATPLHLELKPADAGIDATPPDPIGPELEFLKQPLPDFYPPICQEDGEEIAPGRNGGSGDRDEDEDKSDTSSQYSKTSSANLSSANQAALEEKLREMSEHCAVLETRVAQLSLENRQLLRRVMQQFNGSGTGPSSSLTENFLISIPHARLLKPQRAGSAYYAYEIHIKFRSLEHWSVLRRYRDFYKLHKSLRRTHPSIAAIEFPPKKHFGNMNIVFVEERRQQLQIYLLNLAEALPQIEACKTKAELQKVFPFLRER